MGGDGDEQQTTTKLDAAVSFAFLIFSGKGTPCHNPGDGSRKITSDMNHRVTVYAKHLFLTPCV
jgi:hypothetical protein